MTMNIATIPILVSTNHAQSLALAKQFNLPTTTEIDHTQWQLEFVDTALQLSPPTVLGLKPFKIDFLSSAFLKRIKEFGVKQPLAKAVGYKPNTGSAGISAKTPYKK